MKEGVMKKISLVFCFCIVCVCSFLLIGCAKITFRFNDYLESSDRFDGWDVSALLIGGESTSKEAGKEVVTRGTPYRLFIYFRANSVDEGSVKITSIELYNTHENTLAYKNDNVLEKKFKPGDELRYAFGYNVCFPIHSIDLEYVPYTLVIKYKTETVNSVLEGESTLFIKQGYRESEESTASILMSL